MGLFEALVDIVSMPIRVAVDVVEIPAKIIEGEDGLLENVVKGLKKIEKDLDD